MSITVCTVSGKGGTGKSTVSSGLSVAAAINGFKVLLIDLDSGLRCLDMIFGIDDRIVFDLSDALRENDIKKAIYPAANYQNIFIVPAAASGERTDFLKLSSLLETVRQNYDFVILDFPAGADFSDYGLFPDALFLVVSGADSVSIRDAGIISRGITANKPPRLIINRFDIDMIKGGIYKDIDSLIDTAAARLIGIVPADSELLLFSATHKLKAKGRAVKAFCRIIKRISGEDVRLPKLKKI